MSSADRGNASGVPGRRLPGWPQRYGFALLAVLIATSASYMLGVAPGLVSPFVIFIPAILLVALRARFWPGIFATVLSVVSLACFFWSPLNVFGINRSRDIVELALFSGIGVVTSWLANVYRHREARLREFERAVEGVDEMIVVLDRDYRYVLANRAFLNYHGLKRDELIGNPIADVLNPNVFENTLKEKIDECFEGKTVQFEMCYRYPTRGERELLITYFPVEGRNGVDRIACILQDTTERKASERSLKLFRILIDHSNDGIQLIESSTLRILDVNEESCKDLGYTRPELLSMTLGDIAPSSDHLDCDAIGADLQRERALLKQVVYRRKDGSEFPVEVSFKYVELDRGYIIAVSKDISERGKAEQALRESEDRYRDLVQNSEDLICTHDLEGNLLSVNPAPARILGYKPAELLNIPMRDLVVPEYREQFDAYLTRIKARGSDKGLLFVQAQNGERRTWEYNNTLRSEGAAPTLVRGMAHDITDRRHAESAQRKSEEHFRILVEQASDGIFLADAKGCYLDVNTAGAQMLGYSRDEILHRSICDVIAEREISRIPAEIARFAAGAVVLSEWTFRRKDGSCFPGEVCGRQLPDGRLQGILRDVTERKHAEEEMRRSEERFRVALKDSPITVFNQDQHLRYTWIYNPQLYWQHDAVGKTDEEILGTRAAANLTRIKQGVLTTGVAVREEIIVPKDGRRFAFDLSIEPLFDAAGKVVGITGAGMDIAKLLELADRLQDSRDRLQQEKSYLEKEIRSELGFAEIIGRSPALEEVLKKTRVVAPIDSTVLLLGETGTGKELIARSLHSLSSRRDKTFVKLNCAAVPSGLLESELFGHEKGAFTGAVSQKVGRIELADNGTLFLDEIGELPQELQPKLLRVLQDREFERLGSVHTLRVDVRIISATNRDLRKDVLERRFREDLYYRLNVFPIQLPALRDRTEDIPLLVRHFVEKHAKRMGKHIETIPDETMRVLQNWRWPGNVRELENMIERMIILTKGRVLVPPPAEIDIDGDVAPDDLSEMEREHIIRVLRETSGVLSGEDGAAVRLGLKRTTLQSMLKRFGIDLGDFRRKNGSTG